MILKKLEPLAGREFGGGAAMGTSQDDLLLRIGEFLKNEVSPHMTAWYRENAFPRELFMKAAAAGLFGFVQEGGTWREAPAIHTVLVQQSIAEVSPGIAVSILAHDSLGLYALYRFGNEEQRRKYFEPGLRGEKIAAFANTEPMAGSDASSISLEARQVSDGYLLNGTKMFITNGTRADFLVVSAVTDPKAAHKHEGISLFIVEPKDIRRTVIRKRVWVPSDLATLHFKDVFVPKEALLGEPNQGFSMVMQTFSSSRIAIAALTVGTALGAFALAFERANARRVFGRTIIEHEAKSHEFAEMWTRLEAARLLVLRAAWLKENGHDYVMAASMAKLFACEQSFAVTRFAADIFGASGIIEDNPISKFPLDAWAASLGEGTNDIQRRVIARELIKRWEA
jgi:alkylation response protein AidB-like acyl-CoA dehydrogenase